MFRTFLKALWRDLISLMASPQPKLNSPHPQILFVGQVDVRHVVEFSDGIKAYRWHSSPHEYWHQADERILPDHYKQCLEEYDREAWLRYEKEKNEELGKDIEKAKLKNRKS